MKKYQLAYLDPLAEKAATQLVVLHVVEDVQVVVGGVQLHAKGVTSHLMSKWL